VWRGPAASGLLADLWTLGMLPEILSTGITLNGKQAAAMAIDKLPMSAL
jgi:hypothetical protein